MKFSTSPRRRRHLSYEGKLRAVPEKLVGSGFFGHEKETFSGAHAFHAGVERTH